MSPVDRRALESVLFTAMEDLRAAFRGKDTEAKRLAASALQAYLERYRISLETAQEKAK